MLFYGGEATVGKRNEMLQPAEWVAFCVKIFSEFIYWGKSFCHGYLG